MKGLRQGSKRSGELRENMRKKIVGLGEHGVHRSARLLHGQQRVPPANAQTIITKRKIAGRDHNQQQQNHSDPAQADFNRIVAQDACSAHVGRECRPSTVVFNGLP